MCEGEVVEALTDALEAWRDEAPPEFADFETSGLQESENAGFMLSLVDGAQYVVTVTQVAA